MKISEKLKEYLDSPEGKASLESFSKQMAFEDDLVSKHIEWFLKKPLDERIALVKKVIDKYASDAYKDKWIERGIEPPNDLFYEYFEYAQKKGEDVYDFYYKKYHRAFVFTSEIYKTEEGFIVERLDGQGSFISVSTVDDFEDFIKSIHEKYTNKINEMLHPESVAENS